MLKVDLAELIREPGEQMIVDIDDMPLSDDDIHYLEPAKGKVNIANTGGLLLVRGHFQTAIQLECGRCLVDVREPIDAIIEEQYTLTDVQTPYHHDAQVAVVPDEENEVPEGLMDGAVIDLGVLIRQAVFLEAPIGPVCKEDCLGLCPSCGANRNDSASTCRCEQVTHNTPLAALKSLYIASDESESGPASSHSSNGASAQ